MCVEGGALMYNYEGVLYTSSILIVLNCSSKLLVMLYKCEIKKYVDNTNCVCNYRA